MLRLPRVAQQPHGLDRFAVWGATYRIPGLDSETESCFEPRPHCCRGRSDRNAECVYPVAGVMQLNLTMWDRGSPIRLQDPGISAMKSAATVQLVG